eukprot:COSAG01_NODE_2341_length_7870_cov_22.046712_2_plen_360_part_00
MRLAQQLTHRPAPRAMPYLELDSKGRLSAASRAQLKKGAYEKLAAQRGVTPEELRALRRSAGAEEAAAITKELSLLVRRAITRAELNLVAGTRLATERGFGSLQELEAAVGEEGLEQLRGEVKAAAKAVQNAREQRGRELWQRARLAVPLAGAVKVLSDIPIAVAQPRKHTLTPASGPDQRARFVRMARYFVPLGDAQASSLAGVHVLVVGVSLARAAAGAVLDDGRADLVLTEAVLIPCAVPMEMIVATEAQGQVLLEMGSPQPQPPPSEQRQHGAPAAPAAAVAGAGRPGSAEWRRPFVRSTNHTTVSNASPRTQHARLCRAAVDHFSLSARAAANGKSVAPAKWSETNVWSNFERF